MVAAARPVTSNDARIIETSIPYRLDALRWSGFHTRVVLALGITWILDGLEVTLAGALSGALKQSPTLHFSNFDVGFSNSCLSRRRGARRARVRLAHRSDRPQETVLHHAGALSGGHRGDGAVLERRKLCAVPVSDRRRHRRRIHRDQFDDPGTGAGALSRMDRSRDQRQFLDRRGAGRDQRDRAARSAPDRPRSRLAARLSHRRLPRPCGVCDAYVDSGKSAVAGDPWSSRSGQCDRARYRALGHGTCARPATGLASTRHGRS